MLVVLVLLVIVSQATRFLLLVGFRRLGARECVVLEVGLGIRLGELGGRVDVFHDPIGDNRRGES